MDKSQEGMWENRRNVTGVRGEIYVLLTLYLFIYLFIQPMALLSAITYTDGCCLFYFIILSRQFVCNVKCTLPKCTIQWFLAYSPSRAVVTTPYPGTFPSFQKETPSPSVPIPRHPSPPTTNLLSVPMDEGCLLLPTSDCVHKIPPEGIKSKWGFDRMS